MKRQNLSLIIVSLILIVASARYLQSQIQVRVDLVVLPVVVKDSKGGLVAGLTREDFVVREDGAVQTISNFDVDPQPLSAAIIVDDGMSGDKLRRLYPAFSAPVFDALASGLGTDGQVATFRYDDTVHQLSNFSADPEMIERSFDAIKPFVDLRPEEAPDVLGEKAPGWFRSALNVLSFGHRGELHPRAGGVLHDAIFEAATALAGQPRDRKRIILIISDGRTVGPNHHAFDQNSALLLQNDIQVYGVSTAFGAYGSGNGLSTYAQTTGGDVFPGTSTKAMESSFSRIVEQARYQYVLGYVSTNHAEHLPVFRTIDVKTRTGNYQIIHRKGYLQHPAE
jgi:VWFA-related protein